MKAVNWLLLCAVVLGLTARAASKLESGAIYDIQLAGGRSCPQDDGFLGFYNRSCGALPPKSVGPSLRSAQVETWRQWRVVLVGESATEQWGYLETHYPEEWGQARCVGSIVTLSSTCSDADARVATINAAGTGALVRFVPLKGSDGTYRIILKDRKGGCYRFLSGSQDCSVTSVGFAKNDYAEGLQRWVMTKVGDSGSPTPAPTTVPTPTPTATAVPTPTPSPSPPVQAPAITAAYGTSFTSANVTIASPDASVTACTVSLSPGGQSVTVTMPSFPGMATVSFTQLTAATSYKATASCQLADGSSTPSSDPVAFMTFGGSYNRPPPGTETQCDGRGETVDENGQCVCDAYNIVDGPFKANGEGGCECFDDAEDLGYGPCICPQYTVNCYEGCCSVCAPQNYTISPSNADSANSTSFGRAVALNAAGDVLVVSDNDADYNDYVSAGLVYVFRYSGSDWVEEAILSAGEYVTEQYDYRDYTIGGDFGRSVAINSAGDRIAVGDPEGDAFDYRMNFGKVLLFEKSGSEWSAGDILRPTFKRRPTDDFGYSVALNGLGTVMVVGDWDALYQTSSDYFESAGLAFVYVYNGSDWNYHQTLDAGSDAVESAEFGESVAIDYDGDVIAVGDTDGPGKVFIFRKVLDTWVLNDTITASDYSDGDEFGKSIALDDSGDVLVVGDEDWDGNDYNYAGQAYVFRFDDQSGSWREEAILNVVDSDRGSEDYLEFGVGVAISGDGTVIAIGEDDDEEVYIYRYNGTDWNFDVRLIGNDADSSADDFGVALALNQDGTVLVVGDEDAQYATLDDEGMTFVYRYNGADWELEQTLTAGSEAVDAADFGCSVAINAAGNVIAIGDFDADHDGSGNYGNGKVYIFTYSGGSWSLYDSFNGSDTGSIGESFGQSVALDASGNVLVVGDHDADVYSDYDDDSLGKVYVIRNVGEWIEEAVLVPPKENIDGWAFGWSVSMNDDGDVILVGDPFSTYNYKDKAGLAYVFMWNGSDWIDHILSAEDDTSKDANFGYSTALNAAGDVAVVGAKDIGDGTPGKVYVFRYNGASWSRTDVLAASDADYSLLFGYSVALNAAGDVLVVGDRDAEVTGAPTAGQAYVFRYDGETWVEEQILTSGADARDSDDFGISVAINAAGDVITVGDFDADVSDYDSFGKAYLFKYDGSSWYQDKVMRAPDGSPAESDPEFGGSVAMDETGKVVAVGSRFANPPVSPDYYGQAHVFEFC